MINYECDSAIRIKMTSDCDDAEKLIALADSVSIQRFGERMDSLDLGDSMGVFQRVAIEEFYAGELSTLLVGDGFWVQVDLDCDLFNWTKSI